MQLILYMNKIMWELFIIIIITSLFIEDYILSTCKYLSNMLSS